MHKAYMYVLNYISISTVIWQPWRKIADKHPECQKSLSLDKEFTGITSTFIDGKVMICQQKCYEYERELATVKMMSAHMHVDRWELILIHEADHSPGL